MLLVYFGIWYIMGKMDLFKLSYRTNVLFTNAILLSVINTAAATIFQGVTYLAIVRKKRYLLLFVIFTLPTVFITTTLCWKFFRNGDNLMYFLLAGFLVFASHAWLKVTQLYRHMYGANAHVAREDCRSSSSTADLEAQIYVIDDPPAYESLQVSRIFTPPPKYNEVDQPIPIASSETFASQNNY